MFSLQYRGFIYIYIFIQPGENVKGALMFPFRFSRLESELFFLIEKRDGREINMRERKEDDPAANAYLRTPNLAFCIAH